MHSLGLEMRHAARRRHAVLGDEQRSSRMMTPQVQQVAKVVRRPRGGAGRPVSHIESDEVGIVRVGVIRREIAGHVRRGRPYQHSVQRIHVVVVLLEPRVGRKAEAAAQGLFLCAARLCSMVQRVERRPVGIGDRPLRVVDIPFIPQQLVTLLRQPHIGRRAAIHGEKPPTVAATPVRPPVVRADRERLPLPPQHERQHVLGDVGVVAPPRVPRLGGDQRATVDHVHRPPHLAAEVGLPTGGVVIAARGQLGPHPVHQPEGAVGVRFVPAPHRAIECRRENRVEPHRVRVGEGDQLEPACVGGVVGGELSRELPRQRGAEVDSFHVKRLPAFRGPHLEVLPLRARRDPRLQARRHRRRREPRVHAPREQLIHRVGVARRERDRPAQDGHGVGPPAQPPPGHAQAVPAVRCRRVRRESASEQALRLPRVPLAQQHEPGADGGIGCARTQGLGGGELGCCRVERAAPVRAPRAVDLRGGGLGTDRDRGVLRRQGHEQDEHDGRTT